MLLAKVASFLLGVAAVSYLVSRLLSGEQIVLLIIFLIIGANIIDMGRKR